MTNSYQYDSLNRLTNLVWNPGTSPLASFAYTLGPSGNRIGLSETISSTVARTYAWQYDKLYRLTNETVTGTTPTGTLGYQYDAVGNRLARTSGLGLSPQSLSYGTNDWLTTDTYDANGNTVDSSGANYQYDFENRLTNFNNGQVILVYDADGNRVKKITGTTTTLYLVGTLNPSGYPQVLEELTVAGGATNLSRAYTWGLSLISQRIPGSSTNFYGFDGHGNTRFLTDLAGHIANTYTYDAFGNLINSSGTVPNNFLYCGYQFDPDIGLVYDNARYLNLNTGRFWTSDGDGYGNNEDPLSLHKYLYAENEPADGSDPSGHDWNLASLGVTLGGIAGIASQNAQVVTEAGEAAETSLIESESLVQTLTEEAEAGRQDAIAELQDAFESGNGGAVGRAFKQFGELAENTANNIIRTALNGTKYNLTPQPQYGSRFLDFAIKSGEKVLQMEVKYNLPRSGAPLSRLAAQVEESVASGKGQTVVWSFRPPPPAVMNAVQKALGANYSKVVFKSGVAAP